MKKIIAVIIINLITILGYGQEGIGTNTPNPDAVLHLASADSSQGIIIPKVTTIKRPIAANAIKGMMVFNVTDNLFQICDGTKWITITSDSLADHDFYKMGTTQAPQSINDSIFTLGNVGIGITNPQESLEVAGIINAGSQTSTIGSIILTGRYANGSSTTFGSHYSDGGPVIGYGVQPLSGSSGYTSSSSIPFLLGRSVAHFDSDIEFLSAAASTVTEGTVIPMNSTMIIKNNGNVGIGTTAPNKKLQVAGGVQIGSNSTYTDLVLESGTPLPLYNQTFNIYARTVPGSGTSRALTHFKNTGGSIGKTRHDLAIDGNVGIGTTSPKEKFHVDSGNIYISNSTGIPNGSSAGELIYGFSSLSYNYPVASIEAIQSGGGFNVIDGNDQYGHLLFKTADLNANPTEKMRLTHNGKLGIGITSPSKKLHIDAANDSLQFDNLAGTGTLLGIDANGKVFKSNAGSSNKLEDADGDTKIRVEKTTDEDVIRFDIEGTEHFKMIENSSGIARMEILNNGRTTAIGFLAGANDDGTNNENTYIGYNTGNSTTSSGHNTGIGYNSLGYSTGGNNSATGFSSLQRVTGNFNTSMGSFSGENLNGGNFNTFLGAASAKSLTSGSGNTIIGANALRNSTITVSNTIIGSYAGENITTGGSNILFGSRAGDNITTGNSNIIIGTGVDAAIDTADNQLNIGNTIYGDLSTGKIGIGTTSPSVKTEISGNSGVSAGGSDPVALRISATDQDLGANTWNTNSEFATVQFYSGDASLPGNKSVRASIGSKMEGTAGQSSALTMSVHGSEHMRISSTGNVGIGTANPAEKLHIEGESIKLTFGGYVPKEIYHSGHNLGFKVGGTERMRILNINGTLGQVLGRLSRQDYPSFSFIENSNAGMYGLNKGVAFSTKASFKVIIDSNGNVGIGTASPSQKLQVDGNIAPTTNNSYTIGTSTLRWSEIYATNGVINTSDKRMKTNISSLTYGLNEVKKLNTVTYNWKDNNNGKRLGFIAQELQQVIPEVITTANDSTKTLGVRYTELIPVLTKAIQEQQQIIEELKSENNNLKNVNTNNTKSIKNLKAENNNKESRLDKLENQLINIQNLLKEQQGIGQNK